MVRDIIFNDKELKIIKKFILNKEEYIKNLGEDIYTHTEKNSLTGRYYLYNFLNSEIGPLLRSKIFKFLNGKITKPASLQCWANTFRKNEGIRLHHHGDNKFKCANIFICGDPSIGTFYEIDNKLLKYFNVPGQITLFDSDLKHGVEQNFSDDIRISIALDIHEKPIKTEDTRRFLIIG